LVIPRPFGGQRSIELVESLEECRYDDDGVGGVQALGSGIPRDPAAGDRGHQVLRKLDEVGFRVEPAKQSP
jgi:hypothetical protein